MILNVSTDTIYYPCFLNINSRNGTLNNYKCLFNGSTKSNEAYTFLSYVEPSKRDEEYPIYTIVGGRLQENISVEIYQKGNSKILLNSYENIGYISKLNENFKHLWFVPIFSNSFKIKQKQ